MKDIFISYRRKNQEGQAYGTTIATLIYDKLNDARYEGRVFLDHQGIENENFEEKILKTIRQAKVFILLLTQDTFTFDICQNNEDWVRREISEAKKSGLEIIVINYNNEFKDDYPENFPEELCWLKTHNRQIVRAAEFSDDMAKLISNIISPAIKRKKLAVKETQRYLRRQKIREIIKSHGKNLKYIIVGVFLALFAIVGVDKIEFVIEQKRQEKMRLEQEEAARQAKVAADRLARKQEEEEVARQAKAAADRLARKQEEEEAARQAKAAADRLARKQEEEEAARQAKAAADQLAKKQEEEEAARQAKAAADRLAKEQEEAAQKAKEKAELKMDEFYLTQDKIIGKQAIKLYEECLIKYEKNLSQDDITTIKETIKTLENYI